MRSWGLDERSRSCREFKETKNTFTLSSHMPEK